MAEVKKGTVEMLDELEALYTACKEDLNSKGIYQWFDSYPNRDSISWNLEHDCTYALVDDAGTIVGVVVLNPWQSEEWDWVQWTDVPGDALVMHGLAMHPAYQGKGYGKQLLQFSEDLAKELGHGGIRLDAYSGNPDVLSMYERNGYTCVGAIYFESKPQPYNWYNCYEKLFETSKVNA